MRVIRKLLVPTLIFFGLIITGLITYNMVVSRQQFDVAEEGRLEDMSEVFDARLKSKADLALALASEVANNPEIQAAFAAGDRERLIELTLPSYQVINAQFDVPQYQFHLPPATSFLRLHSLDKYGDDLSSFRFTVLAANAEKRAVSGPELGRGGLGVRGVVPVSYQGRHIGSVEFGTDIGSTLIEELKGNFGYDMQILLSRAPAEVATFEGATGDSQGPISALLLQASTLNTPFFASAANYDQALAGSPRVEHLSVHNLEYAIYSVPLYDYSGSVIGVVDIISDHTIIAQQQKTQMILSVGILLVILLASSFAFALFARRTLRPIGELTSVASSIAAGHFNQRTNVNSDDELGTLAQAFDSMATQLQELFGTLEQRVADRTRALTASAEVSRRLSTATNPRQLAVEVVEQVQSAFQYYHAHIYFLEEETGDLIMAGGTGEAGATLLARGHKVPRGRGLVGRAAETNVPVLVPDVSQAEGWLPNPLLPDTRSEAAVPISSGNQVLGVLDVQQDTVNGLSEMDVELLGSLAAQVAISLQNARTFEESRAKAELESMVNTIGQKIQKTSSVEDTLQIAIRELGLALGASRVSAHIAGRKDGGIDASKN